MIYIIIVFLIICFLIGRSSRNGETSQGQQTPKATSNNQDNMEATMKSYITTEKKICDTFGKSNSQYEYVEHMFSVEEMGRIYTSNSYEAKKDFGNKIVVFRDSVLSIDVDEDGEVYIVLGGGETVRYGSSGSYVCEKLMVYLDSQLRDNWIENVKAGDTITVIGLLYKMDKYGFELASSALVGVNYKFPASTMQLYLSNK